MITIKNKIMIMVLMTLYCIAAAEAQHYRGAHRPIFINPRPVHVTKVVSHPVVRRRRHIYNGAYHGR